MRIAIIRNADHSGFGGAETFPIELIGLIKKSGNDAFLVSSHPGLLEAAERRKFVAIKGPWLKYRDWHGTRQLLLPLYICWQMYLITNYLRMIFKYRPDVLHPQSRDDFIAATIAGKLMRRRVIWTDHADLKFEFRNIKTLHKNWLGKAIFFFSHFADAITVVSNSERKLIEESIGSLLKDKIHVVHNGAIEKEFSAVEKSDRKIIIGSTSRMVAIKGLPEVIEAFQAIDAKNVELWLVGDGPERPALEKQAADDDRIVFFGHKTNPLDYLAAFDIFVLASHTEGFSVALLEAAMLKKAIVATDIGGNPELVTSEETGLLVPAHSPKELQKAFEKLIADTALRQKLASNARKLYEKSFNFEFVVNESFLPLYEGKR